MHKNTNAKLNVFWDEISVVLSNGPMNVHGLIVVFHMT